MTIITLHDQRASIQLTAPPPPIAADSRVDPRNKRYPGRTPGTILHQNAGYWRRFIGLASSPGLQMHMDGSVTFKGCSSPSLLPRRVNALGILIASIDRDPSTGQTSSSAFSNAGEPGTCAGFACFCKVNCWFLWPFSAGEKME